MLVIKGGQKLPQHEIIPTPSFGLNYILGGGLYSGRVHLLWGNTQAGKSTFALHCAAEAQEMGYIPVIIDAEGTTTDEWLDFCGIDPDIRIVIRSTVLEDINSVILPMMREQDSKYFFIVDSINAIVFESFYKDDTSAGAIGVQARSQNTFLQKISDPMTSSVNHVVVCIAQVTMKSAGMYFKAAAKVGIGMEHWATNMIRLTAGNATADVDTDVDDRIVERKVTWKIEKSKQAPVQGTKGDYWFSPETASIDKSKEAFHLGVRNGVIEKSGKWYKWKGESYNGEKKLLEALTDEDYEEILAALTTLELDFESEEVFSRDDD